MKTKLEMAHEWAIELLRSGYHSDDIISCAWQYADLMQAEADKRLSEAAQKEEWQPDWSQAPDDATAWEYLGHNSARWHTTTKGMYRSAELFGFGGTDMLILERPN